MITKEEIVKALDTVAEFCKQYEWCQKCPVRIGCKHPENYCITDTMFHMKNEVEKYYDY